MSKKFLFICGAPRSGTTMLNRIVGANTSVALGIERYKSKVAAIGPDLFQKQFFFGGMEEDGIKLNDSSRKYYARAEEKYETATYVGDKIPGLYRRMELVNKKFPEGATFIFCFRNLIDVAASWDARARDEKDAWPSENNYLKAPEVWQDSLEAAVKAKNRGVNVILFDYDHFLSEGGGRGYYLDLLAELKISVSSTDDAVLSAELGKYEKIKKGRAKLTVEQVLEIVEKTDASIVDRFLKKFDIALRDLPKDLRQKVKLFREEKFVNKK